MSPRIVAIVREGARHVSQVYFYPTSDGRNHDVRAVTEEGFASVAEAKDWAETTLREGARKVDILQAIEGTEDVSR